MMHSRAAHHTKTATYSQNDNNVIPVVPISAGNGKLVILTSLCLSFWNHVRRYGSLLPLLLYLALYAA